AVRRLLRAPAARRRGHLRRRPAGEGGHARAQALRRAAAPARLRPRARRRPGADLPRRADHRLRPGRATLVVGDDPLAARPRQDRPADDALPRRGRAALGSRRGPTRRAHRRNGDAGRPDAYAGNGDPLPAERRGRRPPDRGADACPRRADGACARSRPRARRTRGQAAVARRGLPRADRMRLFAHELRGELLLYTRSRELAFFTFLLPLILFVLLGSTYGNDRIGRDRGANFLEAGMLGYGLVSTAFAGLAI